MEARYLAEPVLLLITLGAAGVLGLYFFLTASRHRRRLAAIPIRIHVAGTRGKSSTVRLIAGGLRAGGFTVVAKTTGTSPRLIRPDGSEETWFRRGAPSIREQLRFVRLAARMQADAIVVECMAIKPDLVWASEHYFIRSTTVVITNTRADHAEELGPGAQAAALSLSSVVPERAQLIVAAEAAVTVILERAERLETDVTVVATDGLPPLDANRELAFAACAAAGVPCATAVQGMSDAAADPGAFSLHALESGSGTARFVNAFSCNDVQSLELLWNEVHGGSRSAAGQQRQDGRTVVLLNVRTDRPLRTKQFLEFLRGRPEPLQLFIHCDFPLAAAHVQRVASRLGFERERVSRLLSARGGDTLALLAREAGAGGTVWGIGNYQGIGERIISLLPEESATC